MDFKKLEQAHEDFLNKFDIKLQQLRHKNKKIILPTYMKFGIYACSAYVIYNLYTKFEKWEELKEFLNINNILESISQPRIDLDTRITYTVNGIEVDATHLQDREELINQSTNNIDNIYRYQNSSHTVPIYTTVEKYIQDIADALNEPIETTTTRMEDYFDKMYRETVAYFNGTLISKHEELNDILKYGNFTDPLDPGLKIPFITWLYDAILISNKNIDSYMNNRFIFDIFTHEIVTIAI
jgi:hypothetical protein